MDDRIFSSNADRYWQLGLSIIPVKHGTKEPAVQKWTSFLGALPKAERREEWIKNFGDCGIGLLLGQKVIPGFRLVAIDVDDDRLVAATRNIFGNCPSAKKGKKGETVFALVPTSENLRSTTFKGAIGLGNIDILAGGRFIVLPPSVHPETGKPYVWIGTGVADCDAKKLPKLDKAKLDLLKRAIGSEHAVTLTSGISTHDAAVYFSAEMVAAGATDDATGCLVRGLLPSDYSGDTLVELPEIITSARKKGFGDRVMSANIAPILHPTPKARGRRRPRDGCRAGGYIRGRWWPQTAPWGLRWRRRGFGMGKGVRATGVRDETDSQHGLGKLPRL